MKKSKRPDLLKPPHAVFTKIDMKGGDPHKCWPWRGTVINNSRDSGATPIHYVFGRRVMARRLVYSLKKGIRYTNVPRLYMLCENSLCLNPAHMTPLRKLDRVVSKLDIKAA